MALSDIEEKLKLEIEEYKRYLRNEEITPGEYEELVNDRLRMDRIEKDLDMTYNKIAVQNMIEVLIAFSKIP